MDNTPKGQKTASSEEKKRSASPPDAGTEGKQKLSEICVPTKISLLALLGTVAAILAIFEFTSKFNIDFNFGGYSVLALVVFAVTSFVAFLFAAHFSGDKRWYVVAVALGLVFACTYGYLTLVPAPIDISIKDPSDNSSVGYAVSVSGTWQNIPNDRQLWLVLFSVIESKYYPQPGPLTLVKTQGDNLKGIWAGAVFCGEPNSSIGERFIILPVVADSSAGNVLNNTSQGKTGNFGMSALPPGAEPYGSASVTRTI